MKRYSPCFEAHSSPETLPNDLLSSNITASPSNQSGTQHLATPRGNSRIQAYVALKASPNVSANGDACAFIFVCADKFMPFLSAGIGMCL
jgi:hypothetical protein